MECKFNQENKYSPNRRNNKKKKNYNETCQQFSEASQLSQLLQMRLTLN